MAARLDELTALDGSFYAGQSTFESLRGLDLSSPPRPEPTADNQAAAEVARAPRSYAAARGAADPYTQPTFQDAHAAMVAAARDLERTLARVKAEARRRPRRPTTAQGRSRERRPGPCRTTGSRRASTRSSCRGGDSGDPDSDEPPSGRHQHHLERPGDRRS
jgi:hypothetical protein